MFVINGDDFGHSAGVNLAIAQSFREGLVSSTTLMANMPGFEHACELIRELRLDNHVGIHLVLTAGAPLTDDIKRERRFCNRGGSFVRAGRRLRLSRSEKTAVAKELEAQIVKCRKNGLCLTHADSHHHVHTSWDVGTIVIALCRRYGIRYVRLSRNIGAGITVKKRIYKSLFNLRLRLHGLAGVRCYGSLDDLAMGQDNGDILDSLEVSVHPCFSGSGDVVDGNGGKDLSTRVKELTRTVTPVSYEGKTYLNG